MNPGLLLSDDLIFCSRIMGTARSLGFAIKQARNSAELLALAAAQQPPCALIDLQNGGLDIAGLLPALKAPGKVFVVGYGSHVDTATLKAAREAGCDVVLPRSKFVDVLAAELPEWFQRPLRKRNDSPNEPTKRDSDTRKTLDKPGKLGTH